MQLSHKRARVELERAASTSARSYEVGSSWPAPGDHENPELCWLGAGALSLSPGPAFWDPAAAVCHLLKEAAQCWQTPHPPIELNAALAELPEGVG